MDTTNKYQSIVWGKHSGNHYQNLASEIHYKYVMECFI